MSSNNVSKASRKAIALSMKDGLWDILLGIVFIFIALQEPLEQSGWPIWASYLPFAVIMVIGIVVYTLVKRKVVTPRVGLIKASLRTNPHRRWLLLVAVGIQVITLVIFILGFTGWLGDFMPENSGILIDAFFGAAMFAFFVLVGYSMESPRFYLYGFLLGLALPLGVLLKPEGWAVNFWPQVIAGLVMVVGGIVTYLSFLKTYPLVEQGATNG